MNKPTAIDLFCGVGGLSLGLEQAGFDLIAAVDCDRINCQTHKLNFPDCPTVCHDITKLTAASLRQIAGIGERAFAQRLHRRIDLVAGGPPCQSFSMIGKRQLDDERSELIFEFARLAIELDTSYFLMENVPGLLSSKHQWYLERVIKQFRNAGYVVHEPVILNAADYGVPQNRKRLFLMGCKSGFDLPPFPPPHTKTPPTVWDAIGDLPEVNNYSELLNRDWIETDWFTHPGTYAASLRWDSARTFNPNLLTNSKRCQHNPESVFRFAITPPGKIEPISRFHKLNPFGLAPTLRAGTGNDRGNHTAPRPIHPHQPRCITVREGARLHSFPDWFRFHPTILCGFRQLGNSVPPLLGRRIASSIIDVIG